jgi:hypothetical protein
VTHPLAGDHSVDASARLIRHYRYAEERMMRIMGGWIALTPELPAKLLLGRHVWDCAQHADRWGRRLPELRSPAQRSEPPNDAFVRFVDMVERPEARHETAKRLAGVYAVLKPHLVAAYEQHRVRANPIYEPPTRRILEAVIADERRHVAAGAVVLRHLGGADADTWTRELRAALAAAGGVTGAGDVPADVAIDTAGVDIAHDVVALDSRFTPDRIEPDLRAHVEAHRRALVDGDAGAIAADVAGEARERVRDAYAGLTSGAREAAIVAYAALGAQRLVKLRLSGREGEAVLQQRWRREADAWRIVAAEIVAVERRG